MGRQRVIVGLGEAFLEERPDRDEPAGLALLVPIHAVRLGHVGIAISRLGQDDAAGALVKKVAALGVDVSHLQSDPDLATGRLLVRALGGKTGLDAHAAFDNLQWDFDLTDVAQRTDAVVFGALARRSGQARSASDRFLAECEFALRVFDLTNRQDEAFARRRDTTGLGSSEALVVDAFAVRAALPGVQRPCEAAADLRRGGVKLVLFAEPGEPLTLHAAGSRSSGSQPYRREVHEASIVGLVHGILAGCAPPEALKLAERVASHALQHPGEPPPQAMLQRP